MRDTKTETPYKTTEAQDQPLNIKYCAKHTLNTADVNKCRTCKKSYVALKHFIAGCQALNSE